MLLLTDGAVMVQSSCSPQWWKLVPDASGSYVHGTWVRLADSATGPLYYASAVLADGRVFIAGGEYNNCIRADLYAGQIYNPVSNSWSNIALPPGWTHIGDAPCCVLPNGKILLGSIDGTETQIYDPLTNTWMAGGNKAAGADEESWTLMPDETVLTVECNNPPHAEKFVIAANNWVTAGSTPQDITLDALSEIGPGVLLPDGRAFYIGGNGKTALYTPPPVANMAGTWQMGPTFPNGYKSPDAPAVLLPNGNVLCVAGPDDSGWANPTHFFEFDGANLNPVPDPPDNGTRTYTGRLLLLPNGQVLYANGSLQIQVYTPSGAANPAWKPVITQHPFFLRVCGTYQLSGQLLNGLSQACFYGDDCSNATNYPIVKLESGGKVWYCRTFEHSTMGVATGLSIQSTHFLVPCGLAVGSYRLSVIANGIESDAVSVEVYPFVIYAPITEAMVNFLIGSLADGPLWALTPHGPVPVDPWGPEIAKQAKNGFRQIVSGLRELRDVGREITRLQGEQAPQLEKLALPASSSRRRERKKIARAS